MECSVNTCFAWVVGLLALCGLLVGMVVDARTGHPGMGWLAVLVCWAVPATVAAWWLERKEAAR